MSICAVITLTACLKESSSKKERLILEWAACGRLLIGFFSCHGNSIARPIYISAIELYLAYKKRTNTCLDLLCNTDG